MSRRIFKYEIPVPDHVSMVSDVMLPRRAVILSVGAQNEKIYVWALVDTDNEERHYAFKVLETGCSVASDELDGYSFIDTVHVKYARDGMIPLLVSELVWHVWVKP